MKNLNINNSNLFRNFALVCSFLLVSFNLSAQYAPLATATSFVDGSTTANPNSGLDLWYDFGWRRSGVISVNFNNNTNLITLSGNGSSSTTTVTSIDFSLTSSNSLNVTYKLNGNLSQNWAFSRVAIRDLSNNSIIVTS